MITQQQTEQIQKKGADEYILVVRRHILFDKGDFQGLHKDQKGYYTNIVKKKMEFRPRRLMEENFLYKQIIPYLVYHHNGRYFLMQRTNQGSETRLHNRYTLGIGGHVRQEDLIGVSILDWARREFHEEVVYNGTLKIDFIGVLNDDSNAVGRVHLGFVYLLNGDSDEISIRSELKSGTLKTIAECKQQYEFLEDWSKIVLDALDMRSR